MFSRIGKKIKIVATVMFYILAVASVIGGFYVIFNFGSLLAEGALAGAAETGFIGLFTGIFSRVSAGICGAVTAGFVVALLFRPKA